MAYNAEARDEVVKGLPADLIQDAVVIAIQDGKIKDFPNTETWKNREDTAIQVTFSTKYKERDYVITQIFNYTNGTDGKSVQYGEKSNLGKYVKKYSHKPKVSDIVKVITNSDGFFRLKLE
jgi:hypothetical protein